MSEIPNQDDQEPREPRISEETVQQADAILDSYFSGESDEPVAPEPTQPEPMAAQEQPTQQPAQQPVAPEVEQQQEAVEQHWLGVARNEYGQLQGEAQQLAGYLRSPEMQRLEQTDPGRAVLEQRHVEARLQQLQGQAAQIEAWATQTAHQVGSRKAQRSVDRLMADIPAWQDRNVCQADLAEMSQFAMERYQTDIRQVLAANNVDGIKLLHDAWLASKSEGGAKTKKLKGVKRGSNGRFVNRTGGREAMLERAKERSVAKAGGWENLEKSSKARDKAASDLLRSLL